MATPAYLTPQTVTIPLRAGLDKKTSEKAVNPPSLLAVENASFDSPGEIKKDSPYAAASATTTVAGDPTPTPNYRAFGLGQRQCFFAKNDLFDVLGDFTTKSHQVSSQLGSGVFCSTSAEALSEIFIPPSTSIIYDVDYAAANGYELIAASDYVNNLKYIVRDRNTKAIVYSGTNTNLSSNGTARCVTAGNYLALVWHESNAAVKYILINTLSIPATLTTVTLGTDVGLYPCIDASYDENQQTLWVAYHSTASGGTIKVARIVPSTGATTTATVTGTPSGQVIAIGNTTVRAAVAWVDSATGLNLASFSTTPGLSSTLVENAAATSVNRIGICNAGSGQALVVYEDVTGAAVVTRVYYDANAGTVGTRRNLQNFTLAHKPFLRNDLCYFGIGFSEGTTATSTQNFYATVAVDPTDTSLAAIAPVAWYLYGPATVRSNINALPAVAYDPNSAEYRWMGSERVNIAKKDTSGIDFGTCLSLQSLRFDDGNAVPIFGTLGFAGNALRDRDGLIDLAFHFAPTITGIAYSGGGSLVAGQTYQWIAIYESTDSYGNVQRSLPSIAVSGTVTGGNSKATLTITTPFTRRGNTVNLVVYRTQAGLAAPHYRSAATNAVSKRTSAASTTVADGVADATINTQQQLYTDSGVLPNYPPPMGRHWAIHQNRIWSIDEHSKELRYTKTLVQGEAPAWNPILTVPLATDRIEAKALVSSPSGLWVLGQDSGTGAGAIACVLGDGPSDSGTGATYVTQRLEGNNAGISTANDYVATPNGIMFVDSKLGIHMMPMGGGLPQPFGLAVETLRSAAGTLVRPVLLQDRHEVRFVFTSGYMLVYDYVVNQWSTRQLQGSYIIMDSCVWGGKHVVADYSQGIFKHTTSGKDGVTPSYLPTRITTGWIRLADFEGLQRIWDLYLLGTAYDYMGLTATVSYDYDDSVTDVHTYADTDLPSSGALELRIPIRRQTSTAIKVSVLDSESASGTQHLGYGLVSLRLRYGIYERSNRLKPARVKG